MQCECEWHHNVNIALDSSGAQDSHDGCFDSATYETKACSSMKCCKMNIFSQILYCAILKPHKINLLKARLVFPSSTVSFYLICPPCTPFSFFPLPHTLQWTTSSVTLTPDLLKILKHLTYSSIIWQFHTSPFLQFLHLSSISHSQHPLFQTIHY